MPKLAKLSTPVIIVGLKMYGAILIKYLLLNHNPLSPLIPYIIKMARAF